MGLCADWQDHKGAVPKEKASAKGSSVRERGLELQGKAGRELLHPALVAAKESPETRAQFVDELAKGVFILARSWPCPT